MHTRKWFALLATAVLCISTARAGLFAQRFADESAAAIQRLAVVSLLGNELHGRKVGLTVFQNDAFDVEVASWNVDAVAAESLRSMAQEDPRLHDVEVLVPDVATLAASYKGDASRAEFQPKALLAEAAAKGFDAVLLVHRSWNENEPFAMPGLTLLNRRLPGLNRTVPCIGSYVRLLDARTGRSLARAGGDEICSTRNIEAGWRKSWAAYAPEEQAAIETIFKAAVDLQLRMAVTDMQLGVAAR